MVPALEPAPAAGARKRTAPTVTKIQPEQDLTAMRAREPSVRTLPRPVDPAWYAAHELDSYPRALAPIRLDHPGAAGDGNAGARLLLWLRIDEFGQVVDVRPGESGLPVAVLDAARASLTAIPFTPGRKDDRPVKSRVLLSVSSRRDGEQ